MNQFYRVLTFLLCFIVFNSWANTPLLIEEALFTTYADRTANNISRCMNDDYFNTRYRDYILFRGLDHPYKLENGRFQEFLDGTAHLTERWTNIERGDVQFAADIQFSGRISTAPHDSKEHVCLDANPTVYFDSNITFNCSVDLTTVAQLGANGKVVTWTPPVATTTCMIGNTPNCAANNIPDFIYMGQYNGSKYYCSKTNESYNRAKLKALAAGGHLAVICSSTENNYIKNLIDDRVDVVWIGYSDEITENTFLWTNGENCTYTNWMSGQPNNEHNTSTYHGANHGVLRRSDGKWLDRNKGAKYEFIMEIPCQDNSAPDNVVTTQIAGPPPGSVFPIGMTEVKYEAIDECGNVKMCSFEVVIEETPLMFDLLCTDDIEVTETISENGVVVTFNEPSVVSNCPDNQFTIIQTAGLLSGSVFPVGMTMVTFMVSDECGQVAECSFKVTVNPAPTGEIFLTCAEDKTITIGDDVSTAIVEYDEPIAITSCELDGLNVTLVEGLPSGSAFPIGVSTVIYEATDACGEVERCSLTHYSYPIY